jgi:hypothetical protein
LRWAQAVNSNADTQLNIVTVLHQQKALLVLAEEQLHVVELQQQLVKAEQARGELLCSYRGRSADVVVMREHKIALFQARESELIAELAERTHELEEAEVRHHRLFPSIPLSLFALLPTSVSPQCRR